MTRPSSDNESRARAIIANIACCHEYIPGWVAQRALILEPSLAALPIRTHAKSGGSQRRFKR